MPVLSSSPSSFRHLLLDLDGTLIHTGNFLLNLEFMVRILPMLKDFQGWKMAFQTIREMQDIVKTPHSTKTNEERMVDIFEKNFRITRSEAEIHLLNSIQSVFPKLKNHFGIIEGASHFVEWAKDHFTLTLATNPMWTAEFVHMRMRWGGINPELFQSITTADRMHACKPLPEYYLELLQQENFEAGHCLLIGNERKMDLPAFKVGIPVFLIRPDSKSMSCLHEPGALVEGYLSPGAWSGNYRHLQEFLNSSPHPFK